VKLLLDTQCWWWMGHDPDRLPSPLRRKLRSPASQIVVSIVSIWELAIKASLKRFDFKGPPEHVVPALLEDVDATLLAVDIAHALAIVSLPFHHKDPFDRLLIAQAKVEDLTLVTADPANLRYDIATLDARK
jgi:PIN domain nuclease of toxin-antitoxin system